MFEELSEQPLILVFFKLKLNDIVKPGTVADGQPSDYYMFM